MAQYIWWCQDGGGDVFFQLPEEEVLSKELPALEIAPDPSRPWPASEFSFYYDQTRK
jgi:hypothetical protein